MPFVFQFLIFHGGLDTHINCDKWQIRKNTAIVNCSYNFTSIPVQINFRFSEEKKQRRLLHYVVTVVFRYNTGIFNLHQYVVIKCDSIFELI